MKLIANILRKMGRKIGMWIYLQRSPDFGFPRIKGPERNSCERSHRRRRILCLQLLRLPDDDSDSKVSAVDSRPGTNHSTMALACRRPQLMYTQLSRRKHCRKFQWRCIFCCSMLSPAHYLLFPRYLLVSSLSLIPEAGAKQNRTCSVRTYGQVR